ncbi:MAG: respiratory nitrate reductase subunit gamma [Planctomycetes bacterium]|nr:respiratory nitrate reductase subunit gamma [Planctomycetota bacterium]
MAGEFRFIPQETLDDITNLVNPVLDFIVPIVPYLAVLAFLPGFLRAMMQYQIQAKKGPFLDAATDKKLRSVPLSVGVWGLVFMHLLIVATPAAGHAMFVAGGGRAVLEVMTMGFGFFTLLGLLNVMLRYGLDVNLRRKLGVLGLLDMAIVTTVILPSLGVGLYAWSTVRWGSAWTQTVGWQVFADAWTFNWSNMGYLAELPVFLKLHLIAGPLAAAHLFYSRLLTHLIMPRPSLWNFGPVKDPDTGHTEEEWSAGQAAALMYGISAEKSNREREEAIK